MENPVPRQGKAEAHAQPTKRPYQKPSFRCERVFETQALICGKIAPVNANCRTQRKVS